MYIPTYHRDTFLLPTDYHRPFPAGHLRIALSRSNRTFGGYPGCLNFTIGDKCILVDTDLMIRYDFFFIN